MKSILVILAVTISHVMSQRPPYAGTGPIGRPQLASRFQVAGVDVADRLAEVEVVTKEPLPVAALGDAALVNRLNEWPRDHRPFWLINAAIIEAANNPKKPAPQPSQTIPQSQTESLQLDSVKLQQAIMQQQQYLQLLQQRKEESHKAMEQQVEFQNLMEQYLQQQDQINSFQQEHQEFMDHLQDF